MTVQPVQNLNYDLLRQIQEHYCGEIVEGFVVVDFNHCGSGVDVLQGSLRLGPGLTLTRWVIDLDSAELLGSPTLTELSPSQRMRAL